MRRALAPLLAIVLCLACTPLVQTAPSTTRGPEPTFRVLAGSEAQRLVDRSVTVTYAVSYAVAGRLRGGTVSGTWTTFQRTPLLRLDVSLSGPDGRVDVRSYISPSGVIVCEMRTPPRCQNAGEAAGPDASASNELARRPGDFDVVPRETLSLAGEDARCFVFRPRAGVDANFKEAFICYAADGVPLFIEMDMRDGGRLVLEGRVAKRTVTNEELRPPVR